MKRREERGEEQEGEERSDEWKVGILVIFDACAGRYTLAVAETPACPSLLLVCCLVSPVPSPSPKLCPRRWRGRGGRKRGDLDSMVYLLWHFTVKECSSGFRVD